MTPGAAGAGEEAAGESQSESGESTGASGDAHKLPPRPPRTMEALGLLLAVLATPTARAGDVPGYVRAGGMGLLWWGR